MSKKYDIYITYPYSLVKSEDKLLNLIESFSENLQAVLTRIMGREVNFVVKGKDFSDVAYSEFITSSSLFIFFTHSIFEVDTDYKNELQEICDQVGFEQVDLIKGFNKIFKICLEAPKNALKPECLDRLLSYNFYTINAYNRRVRSLDFNSEDKSGIIYSKILDLAYDILRSMKNLSMKANDDEEVRFVYLGLTSYDQEHSRDEIRRELQNMGMIVLPNLDFPDTSEEFKDAVLTNLQKTDFSIQLMGTQYGSILKGSKYSMQDFQNQIIKEYQASSENRSFQRLIWIPQGAMVSDQRQALYLKRLRRDEAEINTEIVESPLETFKTILSDKLEITNHIEQPEYENISRIYLLAEENASEEIENLYSTLALSGLRVFTMDYQEQTGIYTRHLQALRLSDGLIIYQRNSSEYWLRSKLHDIIKAPGIGKKEPFKKIVIVSKVKPDPELIKMIKSPVEVLNEENPDADLILQKLISE